MQNVTDYTAEFAANPRDAQPDVLELYRQALALLESAGAAAVDQVLDIFHAIGTDQIAGLIDLVLDEVTELPIAVIRAWLTNPAAPVDYECPIEAA